MAFNFKKQTYKIKCKPWIGYILQNG